MYALDMHRAGAHTLTPRYLTDAVTKSLISNSIVILNV